MFSLTAWKIELVVICMVILIAVFTFALVRVFLLRKYFNRYGTSLNFNKKKYQFHEVERTVINPIVPEGKSFFKIYKLALKVNPRNFLSYDTKKNTIFLTQEKNYENNKNSN